MNPRLLGIAALLWMPVTFAADMGQDAEAVWSVITSSWEDEVAENDKWPADYVRDDVVSWDADWPVPRDKQSMMDWERFSNEESDVLQHELFPMEVVVAGDTATAFYSAVMVSKDTDGKREREVMGLVETLVRQNGEWKFFSMTSFPMGED